MFNNTTITTGSTYSTFNGTAEAFITFKRGRKKVYQNSIIYLNDQDEFEIELFNGYQEDVLCKITFSDVKGVNTQLNTNGLLIKPGQRIFLDRFLNEAKKFKFSTYSVENSTAAKNAIAGNGSVKIDFYTKYVPINFSGTGTTIVNPTWTIQTPTWNYYHSTSAPTYHTCDKLIGNISTTGSFTLTNCNSNNSIETGQVEKGSESNQKIVDIHSDIVWNVIPTYTYDYKIIPSSRKPAEMKDIKIYCTNCGAKQRKEHKFCASCGTKN